MMERLGIADERITVVHNAVCADRFKPGFCPEELSSLRRQYGISNELMLLCLGTIEPRKNLIQTVRAFRLLRQQAPELPVQLVIAGGKGWQHHEELNGMIRDEPRIRYIGYVPDDQLPQLYATADALCYPSLYEGYGLPLVEAMACGTPVIYGNNSSMPEIADGCGLPVDVLDPRSICDAMARISFDESLRQDLSINSVLRAGRFRWREAASRTLDLYREALEAGDKVTASSNSGTPCDSRRDLVTPHIDQNREWSDAA